MISVKEINDCNSVKDAEDLKQLKIRVDGSLKLLDRAERVVISVDRTKNSLIKKLQQRYSRGGWNLTYDQRSGRNETWYEVILDPKQTLSKQPDDE